MSAGILYFGFLTVAAHLPSRCRFKNIFIYFLISSKGYSISLASFTTPKLKMERWKGRVAVVTGASAGIGAAIVEDLVDAGMVVIGLARREERLQEMKTQLQGKSGVLHSFKTDLTKEGDVKAAFKWVKDNFGGVDVLVNNAGIFINSLPSECDAEGWRKMFDVNVVALGVCTREALNLMKEHQVAGHIININSVASHRITEKPQGVPYSSSKFASKAITEGIRRELAAQKSKIKVTSISPGLVKTEIFDANSSSSFLDFSKANYIEAKDIADAVHYVLSTPPNVQIPESLVKDKEESNKANRSLKRFLSIY